MSNPPHTGSLSHAEDLNRLAKKGAAAALQRQGQRKQSAVDHNEGILEEAYALAQQKLARLQNLPKPAPAPKDRVQDLVWSRPYSSEFTKKKGRPGVEIWKCVREIVHAAQIADIISEGASCVGLTSMAGVT